MLDKDNRIDRRTSGTNWKRHASIANQQGNTRWRLRTILCGLVAVFLVWQVTARSLGAYLAESSPQAALILWSTNPTALLNLADRGLNPQQATKGEKPSQSEAANESGPDGIKDVQKTAGDKPSLDRSGNLVLSPTQIRKWAELGLMNAPLNARGFRILGQLAHNEMDDARTERFMRAAVRRSLGESVAVYWLMHRSYEKQDYSAAIRFVDTLLRTQPQLIPLAMPILARIAEHSGASGDLKKLLASPPPWRSQFFENLPANVSDARTPLDLLLSLRDSRVPPTAAELRHYLEFLIKNKFHELAYYTWLQFLPPEQVSNVGFLFNGSFEVPPSGLPFDWVVAAGSGVTIDIVARPDQEGQRALFIEFGHGRVDFRGITQLVMLPPGLYQFQGKYRGSIIGRRGLQWRITCVDGATTPIAESSMITRGASDWTDFEFNFNVPPAGCRGQYVRLVLDARSASEQLVSGSIWYDELRIVRAKQSANP